MDWSLFIQYVLLSLAWNVIIFKIDKVTDVLAWKRNDFRVKYYIVHIDVEKASDSAFTVNVQCV